MSLFNRKKKVPIQIIKTESLTKPDKSEPATPGKSTAKKNKPVREDAQSGIQISILGKQKLAVDIPGEIKEQLSPEELQAVAQEFSRLALPEIIQRAQAA